MTAPSPDGVPVRPCLRSGLCCKTAPCPFGVWDAARHQCQYLEVAASGPGWTQYRCAQHAVITALPPEAFADVAPAFGTGCCMPLFNANRGAIARALMGAPPRPLGPI